MRNIIYKKTAIKAVIIILMAILMISIWPLGLIKEKKTLSVPSTTGSSSSVIDAENFVQQIFVPSYEHLQYVRFYVTEGIPGEVFEYRIFDSKHQQIAIEEVKVPDTVPGYTDTVLTDLDLEKDQNYFIHLSVSPKSDISLCIGMEAWGGNPNVVAVSFYNDTPLEGMNYVMDYGYLVPLSWARALLYIGTILLIGLVGLIIFDHLYKNEKLIPVERAFKYAANPLAAALILTCILAIFFGCVSRHLLDNCFAFFAVILLGLILFYGINHDRGMQDEIFTVSYLKSHIPDIIQSFGIAFALQGCCRYVAGLYDIHHRVAERTEMFWFCIVIIAMFKADDILKLHNLIYLFISSVCAAFYYRTNVANAVTADDLFVLRMTVVIGMLAGFIILRTIIGIIKKKLSKPNHIFGIIVLLYFACIVIFRNTRWWTVVLAAAFTLLYLNYGMWEKKGRFLTNVVRGAVMQFIALTVYALLHRPYSTYRSARYTHYFHTATITATYMTSICCIALVLVLYKLYKYASFGKRGLGFKETLSDLLAYIWKELLFFGTVASYLVFTMARTAYAAMFVVLCFVLIVFSYGRGKLRIKNALCNALILLAALLFMFPVVFEVQRTVPALVSEPRTYDIESYTDDTLRGRRLNSNEYMRVGRFIDVFADKILSMPEGTFDIYGEINEYKETHTVEGEDIVTKSEDTTVSDENTGAAEDAAADGGAQSGSFEDAGGSAAADTEGSSMSIAEAEEAGTFEGPDDEYKDEGDYTNGRLDIYRSYIEQLNMTGHEDMGAILSNGEKATHAHDVYLQVAYDHGIPVGMLFVIFGIATFFMSIRFYNKNKDRISYAMLPSVMTVAIAVAGLVEWVYHLSHPMSFLLLVTITPLLFDIKDEELDIPESLTR